MHKNSLPIAILDNVHGYLAQLKDEEKAKVLAHIKLVGLGDTSVVYTKPLSGPIRELIVKQHRIVYFSKKALYYFVTAFKKQSAKTPKRVIDHAKDIYKLL